MKRAYYILETIQTSYKGLIPTRKDGVKRRAELLNATRKIIATHGVQGVKHRAVAKLAKVPLAATTYYFEDLDALLNDAFLDFYECNFKQLSSLEDAGSRILESLSEVKELDETHYQLIRNSLSNAIMEHIKAQVEQREERIIERAFRNEALRNPSMADLVQRMEKSQLDALAYFFTAIGSTDADSDSRELMAIILFLEHRLIAGFVNEKQAMITIDRLFERLIG